MTPLLRRAATCAGLATIGLSAGSQAQIPTKPEPIVGGEIRRPLPAAQPVQQAAPPVVQQSPNGLYALSITDEGIELRGPSGGVKITNAGIEIGASNSSRVTISATGMELWGDKTLQLNAREKVEMVNGPGANIVRLSPAGMELKAKENVEIVNGPSANIVKLSAAGMELTGKGTVQLKGGGTVQIVNGNGPGTNTVTLSNSGMALKGGGTVEITNGPGSANVVRLSNGVELTVGAASVKVGAGGTSLTGMVTLGCPGGRPAARAGDAVGVGPDGKGAIGAGSTTVLICN
jgi:hypothetical protein